MMYSVYIFDGIKNDRRFEFKEFNDAFRCFKRFCKAKARCAMFYHKVVTITLRDKQNRYTRKERNVSELVYATTDFPYTRDRKDVQTHDAMGRPPR